MFLKSLNVFNWALTFKLLERCLKVLFVLHELCFWFGFDLFFSSPNPHQCSFGGFIVAWLFVVAQSLPS